MTFNRLLIGACVLASLLSLPAPARADWFIQPFAGVQTGGSTTRGSAAFGVSGGWLGAWFGAEAEAAWSPSFFDSDNGFRPTHRAATYTGTALVGPRTGSLRPYGALGLGVLRSDIEEVGGLATLTDTRPAVHAGGGVMWDAGHVTIRGDARYIRALDDAEPDGNVFPERFANYDFWRFGGGVAFRW
jgi:hypothetical protein